MARHTTAVARPEVRYADSTAADRLGARTGLMPELLSVYHLLGDPALRIR